MARIPVRGASRSVAPTTSRSQPIAAGDTRLAFGQGQARQTRQLAQGLGEAGDALAGVAVQAGQAQMRLNAREDSIKRTQLKNEYQRRAQELMLAEQNNSGFATMESVQEYRNQLSQLRQEMIGNFQSLTPEGGLVLEQELTTAEGSFGSAALGENLRTSKVLLGNAVGTEVRKYAQLVSKNPAILGDTIEEMNEFIDRNFAPGATPLETEAQKRQATATLAGEVVTSRINMGDFDAAEKVMSSKTVSDALDVATARKFRVKIAAGRLAKEQVSAQINARVEATLGALQQHLPPEQIAEMKKDGRMTNVVTLAVTGQNVAGRKATQAEIGQEILQQTSQALGTPIDQLPRSVVYTAMTGKKFTDTGLAGTGKPDARERAMFRTDAFRQSLEQKGVGEVSGTDFAQFVQDAAHLGRTANRAGVVEPRIGAAHKQTMRQLALQLNEPDLILRYNTPGFNRANDRAYEKLTGNKPTMVPRVDAAATPQQVQESMNTSEQIDLTPEDTFEVGAAVTPALTDLREDLESKGVTEENASLDLVAQTYEERGVTIWNSILKGSGLVARGRATLSAFQPFSSLFEGDEEREAVLNLAYTRGVLVHALRESFERFNATEARETILPLVSRLDSSFLKDPVPLQRDFVVATENMRLQMLSIDQQMLEEGNLSSKAAGELRQKREALERAIAMIGAPRYVRSPQQFVAELERGINPPTDQRGSLLPRLEVGQVVVVPRNLVDPSSTDSSLQQVTIQAHTLQAIKSAIGRMEAQ